MYRQKALDGFQFNNFFIFHQNIDPTAGLKRIPSYTTGSGSCETTFIFDFATS